MAEQTTWIKIDRNILNWRWYQDTNTKVVFLHLLLTANIKDHDFEMDTIHRGEVAVSIGNLSKTLGISYKAIRTALKHLVEGNEVAIRRRPKYLVISILSYDKYQSLGTQRANEGQSKGNQRAIEGQQSKNNKKDKKEKNNNTATKVTVDLEDYGGIFLSGDQWAELEQAVGPGVLIEYVDKVAEWLEENPRQKKTHINVLRKFLRNDGLIK